MIAGSVRAVLPASVWMPLAEAHAARADRLTAGRQARRRNFGGEGKHAVEDFLFNYCSSTPAQLRRWHPGVGVLLETAAEVGVKQGICLPWPQPHAAWKWYTRFSEHGNAVGVDLEDLRRARGDSIRFQRSLLQAIEDRPGWFGCFGLHEWAMLYKQDPSTQRHSLPLRLGQQGINEVVDRMGLRCTHFDAFRFFTPAAAPLNRTQLTRAHQIELDQPGCLHANLDLLKWAVKLGPLVPGDLLLDVFELAVEIRRLDMQASPYDLSELGEPCVAIETSEGRAEYVRRQKDFTRRSGPLRRRLIELCDMVLEDRPLPLPAGELEPSSEKRESSPIQSS